METAECGGFLRLKIKIINFAHSRQTDGLYCVHFVLVVLIIIQAYDTEKLRFAYLVTVLYHAVIYHYNTRTTRVSQNFQNGLINTRHSLEKLRTHKPQRRSLISTQTALAETRSALWRRRGGYFLDVFKSVRSRNVSETRCLKGNWWVRSRSLVCRHK